MSAAPSSSLLTVTAAEHRLSASSTIVGNVARLEYDLCVESYSKTRKMKNGHYLSTTAMVVGGQPWRIKYYPNGDVESSTGHISIFLKRVGGDDGDLRAEVQIDLLVQAGEEAAAGPYGHGFSHTFVADHSYGYPRFVSHENLERPAYLKDDSFTIWCSIAVEAPPFVVDVPPSTLRWHLGDLLGDTEGADVSLDVGGEAFAAHRYVLAARSLVFKAQLFGPMKAEKDTTIRVDDMHADVFRALLHFIYTDELPTGDDNDEDDDDGQAIMAQHLLVAADKYDLPRLKLICENKLSKHLDVSTVATTLALAEQHGCDGLKEVILRFLRLPSNMEAVKLTDGYTHLLESCPSLHQELTLRGILPAGITNK